MRPTDKIDNLIKNTLKTSASPELDQRIDTLIDSSKPAKTRPLTTWSILMKKSITKYAAAFFVTAGLLCAFLFSDFTPQAIAFGDVIEAMKNIAWLHQTSTGFEGDVNGTAEQWLGFETKIHAAKWADGKRTFWDISQQTRYEYDPEQKYIKITDTTGTEVPFSIASPTMMVESMHEMLVQQGADVTIQSTKYDGKEAQLQEFSLTANEQSQCLKLFIDPKSKLLIAAHITAKDVTGKTVMDGEAQFSYPTTGPESIYDLGVSKDTPIVTDNAKKSDPKISRIDQLESWPEPLELVQKYWDARNRKDYETTRLYWPNSEQWDESAFEKETPIEYVFDEPVKIDETYLKVPYDAKEYYEKNQKYRFKMVLSNQHSQKERYYIVSGN